MQNERKNGANQQQRSEKSCARDWQTWLPPESVSEQRVKADLPSAMMRNKGVGTQDAPTLLAIDTLPACPSALPSSSDLFLLLEGFKLAFLFFCASDVI